MEARVVRPPLDRLLERLDGTRVGARALMQERQGVEPFHVPRIEAHRLLERGLGLAELILAEERPAEVEVRLRGIGAECYRAPEFLERLLAQALFREEDSQVRVGLGAGRVRRESALEGARRSGPVAAVGQRQPQIHPRLHVGGRKPHRLFIGALRRREMSLPSVVQPLEVTDLRVPGIALDRPLEAEVRFLEASAPGEKIGQEGVEVGVTRVGENSLAQNVDRALTSFQRYGMMTVLIPSLLPPPAPFKIFVLLAGVAGISMGRFSAAITIGRTGLCLGRGLCRHLRADASPEGGCS